MISVLRALQKSALLLAVIGVGSMVADSAAAETTLERAKREGFIRIAFANEPPFGFATADGKLTGEAPEIARAVFERMGIAQVDGVLVEWAALIPALNAGRFDTIAAGMWIRPARCKQIAFSEPTYGMGQTVLVKAGNPLKIHSYEDVAANSDGILVMVTGAAGIENAMEAGIPEDRIMKVTDTSSQLAAVKSGRAHAAGLVTLTANELVKIGGADVERARPFKSPRLDYGAFGFRKSDSDLVAEFNKHLKAYLGSKEHLDTVAQWDFTEADLPGEVTTASLCERE